MPKGMQAAFDRVTVGRDGAGPMVLHSGLLDGVNPVVAQAPKLIPFRARIVAAYVKVRTAAGTGPHIVQLGRVGTVAYHGSVSVPTTAAANTILAVTITQPIVDKDEVFTFNDDGGATTTGDCDVVVVLEPAGPA